MTNSNNWKCNWGWTIWVACDQEQVELKVQLWAWTIWVNLWSWTNWIKRTIMSMNNLTLSVMNILNWKHQQNELICDHEQIEMKYSYEHEQDEITFTHEQIESVAMGGKHNIDIYLFIHFYVTVNMYNQEVHMSWTFQTIYILTDSLRTCILPGIFREYTFPETLSDLLDIDWLINW